MRRFRIAVAVVVGGTPSWSGCGGFVGAVVVARTSSMPGAAQTTKSMALRWPVGRGEGGGHAFVGAFGAVVVVVGVATAWLLLE